MFQREPDPEWGELKDLWRQKNALADVAGLPHQWVVCPICGAHDWRDPPHGLAEPCPTIVEHVDSQNMKLNAERNLAARSGLQIEKNIKAMQAWFRQHGLLEDEEEE